MNKRLALITVLIFGMGLLFFSCAGMQTKPTAANFKAPKIALEMIEIPQFDGYWYYSGKIKPTKGKAGNHGAPLPMAVTFNITNPNPYPVLLDGYKFTIAFEEFDFITVNGYDTQWIPAGKTNQLRATTMITVRSGLLSLLVTGGFKLKAKGTNAWAALEKWWTTIPDMAFPINIHEGSFTFTADGVSKTLPFKATYPK
ncbi:MAG: hypothetical protein JRI71_13930 [Deltaproteobacteria bacterium]|nr:hypothetical protein [Deltaproteobacteria bacterium]MBW2078615.1 hypothetical protein [Deltaproteobacteria bacterium]